MNLKSSRKAFATKQNGPRRASQNDTIVLLPSNPQSKRSSFRAKPQIAVIERLVFFLLSGKELSSKPAKNQEEYRKEAVSNRHPKNSRSEAAGAPNCVRTDRKRPAIKMVMSTPSTISIPYLLCPLFP